MFNSLRHLLPDSRAWRVVVNRLLRKYLEGLASVGTDARVWVDGVSDDLWPPFTRELVEWEDQFGLEPIGTDATRRIALAAEWAATGGQSSRYIQDILQAAGFTTVFVHDWFDDTDVSISQYDNDIQTTIGLQDFSPRGISFAAGGRKLYMAGGGYGKISQYTLSTPYSLSTAVYDGIAFNPVAQDPSPADAKLSTDGKKMFVLGDDIYEYDLPIAFDIVTAQFVDSMPLAAQETIAQAFSWHPDGTVVYVTGTASDKVHQYDLTVPWDISTASFTQTFDPLLPNPSGLSLSPDGTLMLVLELASGLCTQFNLSTPWDISSALASGHTLDLTTVDATPWKLIYEHGSIFVVGQGTNDLYRFTFGGPRDPRLYTNQPTIGTMQAGDTNVACGEQPPNQTTLASAVCNRLMAGEVWYLWNDTLTQEAPPQVPDDSRAWPYFWYVGGQVYGTSATVAAADRKRFERLLLKLAPTHLWIVTIVSYV